jgi:hypothetical protein
VASDRPSVSVSELGKLMEQVNKPTALTADEVQDYANAGLLVLRGLTRAQKLRVLKRMLKMLAP